MALLRQPPVLIQPGALRVTSARVIPAQTQDFTIQMTDNGDWFSGLTGNVMIWGWQISRDNGVTWEWRHWQGNPDNPNDSSQWLPFGARPKGGAAVLPFLHESGPDTIAEAGHLARLAIQVDTAITLGADITPN